MSGTTILISPLNWGFGHAGRMIPLARELSKRGIEVIFGADAGLLPLIKNELQGIKLVEIRGLRIRYSRCLPQYLSIFLQLPLVVFHAFREHYDLIRLTKQLKPSVIISDNRFGFFHRDIFSIYVTHQVRIPFPRLLRFIEPVAAWLHRMIISRYDLCLVPDYPGPENLSGRLSHELQLPDNVHYMGPLSRFRMPADLSGFGISAYLPEIMTPADRPGSGITAEIQELEVPVTPGDNITIPKPYCCLILSGPEPQRSLLLEKVTGALRDMQLVVLSATPVHKARKGDPGIALLIKPDTGTMHHIITGSSLVISRAGYTSVMELSSLAKGAVLIPTPGQPEQEYLGDYLNGHHGFVTVRQDKIKNLSSLMEGRAMDPFPPRVGKISSPDNASPAMTDSNPLIEPVLPLLPDSRQLFENAINLLLDQNKE